MFCGNDRFRILIVVCNTGEKDVPKSLLSIAGNLRPLAAAVLEIFDFQLTVDQMLPYVNLVPLLLNLK